ncbi:MAG TPA: hypothetical protein VHS31_07205 [Tepidisphaeraceae bacterium]|jgi:hypothetical protein|nr:hypothetical protein [Tepidisphaeraceae bacterium]
MLREQVKQSIDGLSDAALVEYVTTGARMYEPEAVAFAQMVLEKRKLDPQTINAFRRPTEMRLIVDDVKAGGASPPPKGTEVILCISCGIEAPTRWVEYNQNIGALVIRFSQTYRGSMCRRCNRRYFWRATLITLVFGWWGILSFFVAFAYLVSNVISFLRTIRMPRVPAEASAPILDDDAISRLTPYYNDVMQRIAGGLEVNSIAREVAAQAGVRPGHALLYLLQVRQRQANEILYAQEKTGGFPVIIKESKGQVTSDK